MNISGTNISTYGMKLLKVEGLHNLPGRKKTTEFISHDAADIVYQAASVKVTILGRGYTNIASMVSAVTGLKTLILSQTVHLIQLPGRGETFNGAFANGLEATPHIRNKAVVINAEITIVQ